MPLFDVGETTRIAGGFRFLEGPTWLHADDALLFNDIPSARTLRWSPADGVSVVRENNGKANGTTLDTTGRLLGCEHLSSRLVRWEPDGGCTVLASHFGGRALNSPNDVIVSSDGTVFFTDPPFGRTLADMGAIRARELDFAGVYCITVEGTLHLLTTRCAEPNGLCLSPDETRLFVNDTATGEIVEFVLGEEHGAPVVDDGRIWTVIPGDETGSVDGMKLDRAGNLHCTGPGGIHVFDGSAEPLGVIQVPEKVGNFTWGDVDDSTLYICATTSLYATRTIVPGLRRGR